MAKTREHNDVISGMWRFGSDIFPAILVELAEELVEKPDGDKYLDLHVRRCSRTEYAIVFKYMPGKETGLEFSERMRTELERRFGKNSFRWEVSSVTWIIKQTTYKPGP